jgi:nucleoside-diphosphate-sugar epimerase
VARALIVGCGCRGRELGRELLAGDWAVRGTTRREDEATAISESGIEAVVADPDRVWTVLEQVADVALIFWLLGSARGDPAQLGAIHGARLERVLEQIVDTPVRGFVYESGGTVEPAVLRGGADLVVAAGGRWRIPFELVDADPVDVVAWRAEMLAAAARLTAG